MHTRYLSGYNRARAEHIWFGSRHCKRKSLAGVEGASWEWMQGYRDYTRFHCVIRRYEDSVNHM